VNDSPLKNKLNDLSSQLDGEFYSDEKMRILYSTDASAYREMPFLPR
jgi:hypothetical protein